MSELIWTPGMTLDQAERLIIKKALLHYGSRTATADALRIAHKTLYNKLDRYDEEDKHHEALMAQRRQENEYYTARARGFIREEIQPVAVSAAKAPQLQMTDLRGSKRK